MIIDLHVVSLSKEWPNFSLGGAERAVNDFFFRILTQKGSSLTLPQWPRFVILSASKAVAVAA